MICRSFEPVFDESARVLIVGSMPSVKSLEDAQYYAHPRNAFWPILFDIFGEAPSRDYERKKALIRAHNLALWDAAAVCEREGSLDSNMRGGKKKGIRYGLVQFDEVKSVEWWASTFCKKTRGATLYRLRDDIVYRPGHEPENTTGE